MQGATNNSAWKAFSGWWRTPRRSGARLIISPIEYRHLRAWGRVRVASAIVMTGLGTTTPLCFGGNDRKTYAWASGCFLAGAAANLAYGYWEMTIARRLTSNR